MKRLSYVCALVTIGCATAKPPPPAPIPIGPAPSTKGLPFAECVDGVVLPKGSEVPFGTTRRAYPLPAVGARADALLRGSCALDAALAECRKRDARSRGEITLDLAIGPDGKVQSATRVAGTLPDNAVAECVVATYGNATFPKEAAGTAYLVQGFVSKVITIIESHTEIWVIKPIAAKTALRAVFPQIRDCYEAFLNGKQRHVNGTLTFDIVVRGDGTLASVHEDYTEGFDDPKFLQCAVNAIASVKFPPFEQPQARIHYPLALESTTTTE